MKGTFDPWSRHSVREALAWEHLRPRSAAYVVREVSPEATAIARAFSFQPGAFDLQNLMAGE